MISFKDFNSLLEASYAGNIGIMELIKFYEKATPDIANHVKSLISSKKNKEAWDIVQRTIGSKLHASVHEEVITEAADLYPIKETPLRKQYRLNGGLTKFLTVDAKKFKDKFESDNDEKLNWNEKRLENLRKLHTDGVTINAHPEVGIDAHGRLAVNDGRHRISHAAELGKKIKVALHSDDVEHIKGKLK